MAEPPPQCRSLAPWSDIPVELAGLVLLRLRAHVDRVRFAAVCRHWRAAARQMPLPPPLPLLALSDGTARGLPDGDPFRLPRHFTNYTDASGDWLVFVRDKYCCFLKNAFSDAIVVLPALSRVRAWHVNDASGHPCMETEGLTVQKVLFCTPHLVAALVRDEKKFRKEPARVAVCRPWPSSWWSVLVDHRSPLFVDMAFHQGQLYGFDHNKDGLFAIDITVDQSTGDPWVSQVRMVIDRFLTCPFRFVFHETIIMQSIYLVESCGELLMVCRTMHGRWKQYPTGLETGTVISTERNEFEVLKADFEERQWNKVTTIGDDQVLFLRRRCSRSVCVSEHEMPGDSIVFMQNDDEDRDWYDEDTLSSCAVYNMKDSKVSSLLPTVSWKRGTVAATWLFPRESLD
ncbi:unnamed protein product [Urochloa decumbens]|uniref:KIB1-4 beta-propeller domain-containing protein n=1 Tax=Urochloa decumbens TaxID=240449 RepID=A0ABC9AXB0_9POAL